VGSEEVLDVQLESETAAEPEGRLLQPPASDAIPEFLKGCAFGCGAWIVLTGIAGVIAMLTGPKVGPAIMVLGVISWIVAIVWWAHFRQRPAELVLYHRDGYLWPTYRDVDGRLYVQVKRGSQHTWQPAEVWGLQEGDRYPGAEQ